MKWVRILFLLLAVALAGSIIYALGPTRIWSHFHLVGWNILWVFLVGFPRYFLYTLAWRLFLPAGSYPFHYLFQVKVAGELITRSTPIHFVGGDAARVLLMGGNLRREDQAGSVVMDRTVMTLGAAMIVLTGLILATFRLPLAVFPKIVLWLFVGLLFWGLSFIISHQKKTALSSLLELFSHLGFRRWIKPVWREKCRQIDEVIRSHYVAGHDKLIKGSLIIFVARLTVAFEIFLLLRFLGIPLGMMDAVILSSMSLLMTVIFFLFPGNLGILEGTYGILFHWLGLDPSSGVALELLRKLNAGLWYFVGAAIAVTYKKIKREEKALTSLQI